MMSCSRMVFVKWVIVQTYCSSPHLLQQGRPGGFLLQVFAGRCHVPPGIGEVMLQHAADGQVGQSGG